MKKCHEEIGRMFEEYDKKIQEFWKFNRSDIRLELIVLSICLYHARESVHQIDSARTQITHFGHIVDVHFSIPDFY